jgi:hypothetical protein
VVKVALISVAFSAIFAERVNVFAPIPKLALREVFALLNKKNKSTVLRYSLLLLLELSRRLLSCLLVLFLEREDSWEGERLGLLEELVELRLCLEGLLRIIEPFGGEWLRGDSEFGNRILRGDLERIFFSFPCCCFLSLEEALSRGGRPRGAYFWSLPTLKGLSF